jgi:hypothetical protein
MLRIRYRDGIRTGPFGFPYWIPFARAVAEVSLSSVEASPASGVDEGRIATVLAANAALSGDALTATPAGWTWAHLPSLSRGASRRLALVPVELHGAYRHPGGVGATGAGERRGPQAGGGAPPRIQVASRVAEDAVAAVEARLGVALPAAYRMFLMRTNGGAPATPAVHPGFGFVVDQPLFGVGRPDWLQDLVYANAWFGDRLTPDWLAVGYVQGGLLAVKVRGGDEDSVWYFDDDDPRAAEAHTAEDVCRDLLHRCADDITAFWYALRTPQPPPDVVARTLSPAGMGTSLPRARR